eukprot:13206-Heterococcus_DN1.PRE.2
MLYCFAIVTFNSRQQCCSTLCATSLHLAPTTCSSTMATVIVVHNYYRVPLLLLVQAAFDHSHCAGSVAHCAALLNSLELSVVRVCSDATVEASITYTCSFTNA